jgi:hypothetical protein
MTPPKSDLPQGTLDARFYRLTPKGGAPLKKETA